MNRIQLNGQNDFECKLFIIVSWLECMLLYTWTVYDTLILPQCAIIVQMENHAKWLKNIFMEKKQQDRTKALFVKWNHAVTIKGAKPKLPKRCGTFSMNSNECCSYWKMDADNQLYELLKLNATSLICIDCGLCTKWRY